MVAQNIFSIGFPVSPESKQKVCVSVECMRDIDREGGREKGGRKKGGRE